METADDNVEIVSDEEKNTKTKLKVKLTFPKTKAVIKETDKTRWVKQKKQKKTKPVAPSFVRNKEKLMFSSIKDCCRSGKAQCFCNDCNHYEYITMDMVRHYRWTLYDPDKDLRMYETRKKVHELLEKCHRKTQNDHLRQTGRTKFTHMKYHLYDPFREIDIPLCKSVFCKVVGIHRSTCDRIRKRVFKGEPPLIDPRSEALLRDREKSDAYMALYSYLEFLAENLSNESPDQRCIELPVGHKVHYYQMFCKEWEEGLLTGRYTQLKPCCEKPPSKALFYKVWRRDFSALKVPVRSARFSKCDTCVSYKAAIMDAKKSREDRRMNQLKGELYDHYKWVALQRKVYHHNRADAATNPER